MNREQFQNIQKKLAAHLSGNIARYEQSVRSIPTFDPLEIEGMRQLETVINAFQPTDQMLDPLTIGYDGYHQLKNAYYDEIEQWLMIQSASMNAYLSSYTPQQIETKVIGMNQVFEYLRFFFNNEIFGVANLN